MWWRADVGEQISIDWDSVLSMVALGAQGAGPFLKSDEHKMTTRKAEADFAVRRKQSTHVSSELGTGPHGPDRKGGRSADQAGLGASRTRWTGTA